MPSAKYFESLKHRDFALLWSGQAVSQLGDGVVFTVTVALEALGVDHNAIGLSYVLAARLLPAVMFTLVGGVIVERGQSGPVSIARPMPSTTPGDLGGGVSHSLSLLVAR